MKTIFGGIGILTLAIFMGLFLGFGIQAYALTGVEGCPDGNLDAFRNPCPDGDMQPHCDGPLQNICIGRVELSDMGSFDATGAFIWNEAFRVELDGWGTTGYDMFTPRQVSGAGTTIKESRFDYRQTTSGNNSRIAILLEETNGSYEIPELWRVTGPDGQPNGYFIANFDSPEGCEDFNGWDQCGPTGNDCEAQPEYCFRDESQTPMCGPWAGEGNPTDCSGASGPVMDCTADPGPALCQDVEMVQDYCCTAPQPPMFETISLGAGEITVDRMGTLYWVEKNLTIPMTNYDYYDMHSVIYNNDREVQNWEAGSWNDYGLTDHYYRFEDTTPDLGVQHFILTYDGDKIFNLQFNAVDVDPMPVVPATTSNMVYQDAVRNKSGKTIKGLSGIEVEVITPNIIVRTINDALIVQWSEPDLALFPNPFANRIELRMHVGNNDFNSFGRSDMTSLWVEAPYQIGTIVVPAERMNFIKSEIARLFPDAPKELYIQFQYRLKYFDDDMSGSFQNRGYADAIILPYE